MSITITAFEKSPDGGKGLARDTRVRWALHPFGQFNLRGRGTHSVRIWRPNEVCFFHSI